MVRFLYTPFYNLVVLKGKKNYRHQKLTMCQENKKKNHSQLWGSASYNMYRKRQSFQFIHLFHLRAQSVEIIFKNVTRDSLGIVFWTEAGIFKLGSQKSPQQFHWSIFKGWVLKQDSRKAAAPLRYPLSLSCLRPLCTRGTFPTEPLQLFPFESCFLCRCGWLEGGGGMLRVKK